MRPQRRHRVEGCFFRGGCSAAVLFLLISGSIRVAAQCQEHLNSVTSWSFNIKPGSDSALLSVWFVMWLISSSKETSQRADLLEERATPLLEPVLTPSLQTRVVYHKLCSKPTEFIFYPDSREYFPEWCNHKKITWSLEFEYFTKELQRRAGTRW